MPANAEEKRLNYGKYFIIFSKKEPSNEINDKQECADLSGVSIVMYAKFPTTVMGFLVGKVIKAMLCHLALSKVSEVSKVSKFSELILMNTLRYWTQLLRPE